jgi:hypothetical protein
MVLVVLLIGWFLVAVLTAAICVAARLGDEADELRRRDAALPHLPARLSA